MVFDIRLNRKLLNGAAMSLGLGWSIDDSDRNGNGKGKGWKEGWVAGGWRLGAGRADVAPGCFACHLSSLLRHKGASSLACIVS